MLKRIRGNSVEIIIVLLILNVVITGAVGGYLYHKDHPSYTEEPLVTEHDLQQEEQDLQYSINQVSNETNSIDKTVTGISSETQDIMLR